ncbi:HD domain-containing protein [candidate division NPL-UPA2 bacterium]|nr:HD domain-containing protein [candidate division NPL-UPA2 bacterium]
MPKKRKRGFKNLSFLKGCAFAGTSILKRNQSLALHSKRVSLITEKVLKTNPKLADGFDPQEIILAALLHDLGKAVWDDAYFTLPLMLLKPLDQVKMEYHPISGRSTAKGLGVPETVQLIIEQHHERPGGKGYPNQVMDPLPTALLIGAVDAYVACLEPRPYRPKPLPVSEALREAAKVGHGGVMKELVEISKERSGQVF